MSNLLERTNCPYCGHVIIKDYDPENRLFGNTSKCESLLCGKEFIVNCSQINDKGSSLEGRASVREVISKSKTDAELEDGQTMLSEFV